MIDVALLGIIRRWHLRDKVPLREITKRLGISRNTVRRYLYSEITEPAYAERQTASAIDPYALQLAAWLKTGYKIHHTALLVNTHGRKLTPAVLRNHFEDARKAAAEIADEKENHEFAKEIRATWFYDLRAKAADDTADDRGEQEASNLLGHESVKTTQKHYLRRGRKVNPTK